VERFEVRTDAPKSLKMYALGSVSSGKHLFFDTLNIKFREQDGLTKFYSNTYLYKGNQYEYMIYFISGSFKDPALLPSQRTACDAVLLLINPLISDIFNSVDEIIQRVAEVHPDTLIVLIMQNVFGELDSLPSEMQDIALENGEMFCEVETNYNLKLVSLNYNLDEIQSLESGDPMMSLKFFKMFNEAFYEILHDIIERKTNPDLKTFIISDDL